MNNPAPAFSQIIFDFDGVILDSAMMKTRAFAEVYEYERQDLVARVVAYQETHGGVGRRAKFEHFERDIFDRDPAPEDIDRLCSKFATIVDAGMREASFVPGVQKLLEGLQGTAVMHVVTGMPQDDLVRICGERRLTGLFRTLSGMPTTKPDAFRTILEKTGPSPQETLAIGDSTTEFDAARDLGIPFLAIVPPNGENRFPPGIPTLEDFSDLDRVLRTMGEIRAAR